VKRSQGDLVFFWIIVTCLIVILVGILCEKPAHGALAEPPADLWKCLIGEAVGEGYEGMYAVACVFRNRLEKGLPLGCAALKRTDLDRFINRQGEGYSRMARDIVARVFEANEPDLTHAATHFENVKAFGVPRWSRRMDVTVEIGTHTFFRERTQ
jgi:hypothetical protein